MHNYKEELLKNISNYQTVIFNDFKNQIDTFINDYLEHLNLDQYKIILENNKILVKKNIELEQQYQDISEEIKSLKKVSMIKKIMDQLSEKNNIIHLLTQSIKFKETEINKFKKIIQINNLKEKELEFQIEEQKIEEEFIKENEVLEDKKAIEISLLRARE